MPKGRVLDVVLRDVGGKNAKRVATSPDKNLKSQELISR